MLPVLGGATPSRLDTLRRPRWGLALGHGAARVGARGVSLTLTPTPPSWNGYCPRSLDEEAAGQLLRDALEASRKCRGQDGDQERLGPVLPPRASTTPQHAADDAWRDSGAGQRVLACGGLAPRGLCPSTDGCGGPLETCACCVPSAMAVTDSCVYQNQGRGTSPAGVTVPEQGYSAEADTLGNLKTKVMTRDRIPFLVTLQSKSWLFSGFSMCHRRVVKRQSPTK